MRPPAPADPAPPTPSLRPTPERSGTRLAQSSPPALAGAAALLLVLLLGAGCTVVIDRGANTRDYYVFGYARLRLQTDAPDDSRVRVLELHGIGLAVSRSFQLGYFKEFQAYLRPDTNSAVVVLHSEADVARLETLLKQLKKEGLCLIVTDRS